MRGDAAGEDARELMRVAEGFRDEEEPDRAARAYWRAVHVFRRRDEHTKALAVLKRLVALAPNDPAARTATGECLEMLDRRAEAADHFRHAALLAAQAQRPNAARQLYARADRLCRRQVRAALVEDLVIGEAQGEATPAPGVARSDVTRRREAGAPDASDREAPRASGASRSSFTAAHANVPVAPPTSALIAPRVDAASMEPVTPPASSSAPSADLPDVTAWPSMPMRDAESEAVWAREAFEEIEEIDADDLIVARPHYISFADDEPRAAARASREVVLDPMDVAAPVQGTGTALALDVESALLAGDPAEAATARAAAQSPLDAAPEPVVFDSPTSSYAPMMLEDLLTSEEETVAATPMDPLRRAS